MSLDYCPRPFPKYDDPKPYLPNDVPKIFPNRLFPPALRQESHPLSLDVIIAISQTEQDTPHDSPFRHDIHPDEVAVANAEFNSRLIDEYDMDMQRLLDAYPYSVISPGSEFRPAGVLEPLLAGHPYWPRLKSIISHGVSYPLTAVEDETARRAENDAILEYGNHASGKKNPEALTKVLLKDASRGYSLPITFSCAKSIKHSRISPMGVAHQLGIDAHGDLIPKDRLTHDQSFSLGFCPSTNDLIDQEQLIDLVMGHCIDRIIHQIVVLRWHHPTEKILLSKFDWASAYRRIHGDGEVAARNITIDPSNLFAHLNLRLTFGASANPAEFSVVSEIGTDLCNDLADLQEWTPDCCVSPLQSGIGPPQFLSEDIPIAQAQELAVMVPPRPHGFHDCYLDDMIQLFLATEENIHRCPCIVPLIVHLMTRPLADDEPITRKAMLEDDKLKAEGAPVEEQRVLGWTIDTRRLLLRLPYEKKVGWTKQVQELLDKRKTTFANLRSLNGKLLHAIKGIPLASHWLGRLREYQTFIERTYRQKQAAKTADQQQQDSDNPKRSNRDTPPPFYRYNVPESLIADLKMWRTLLSHSHEGISLNRLVCRVPTHLYHADSCPEGMGGYSVSTGRAWRMQIHQSAIDTLRTHSIDEEKRSNNLLEYIAIVVSIWVDCYFHDIPEDAAVLALSDNSSAVGWLHKTSFGTDTPLHIQVSAQLTHLVMLHTFALQAEHIPGKRNEVSDILSRAWEKSDRELTFFIHENYASQIPQNFRIKQLPSEILCWICSIVPPFPGSSSAKPKDPTKSATELGTDGLRTCGVLDSVTTPSSNPSTPPTTEPVLHAPSSNASGKPSSHATATARTLFERALSNKPLETWHRASGITTGRALATVKTAVTSTPSSPPSSARGRILTPRKRERRPSQ